MLHGSTSSHSKTTSVCLSSMVPELLAVHLLSVTHHHESVVLHVESSLFTSVGRCQTSLHNSRVLSDKFTVRVGFDHILRVSGHCHHSVVPFSSFHRDSDNMGILCDRDKVCETLVLVGKLHLHGMASCGTVILGS